MGALVFFHGYYGVPEDFIGFVDKIDPDRRFHGYLPQAPHEIDGERRYAWEDRLSSDPPADQLRGVRRWLRDLAYPIERVVLGGWSQGAWVAYVMALAPEVERPAGVLALGGTPPPRFEGLDLSAPLPPIAIAHGTHDPVVPVAAVRAAHQRLEEAGANVLYRETAIDHRIDPAVVPDLVAFLATLP